MVLKLYAFNLSPPSQFVATVLHEKKVPFKFINVDLIKGEHKTAEFLANQPFGQVPYIEDDGLILYESRAIARYIEAKYPNQGTKLIPTDLRKLAHFEQAAATEGSAFDSIGFPIIAEAIFKKYHGEVPDQAKINELAKALDAKLNVYERILSKQKYLAGDELTLADLAHIPIGTLLPEAGVNFTHGKPNVTRWFNELSNRDSWKTVKKGLASSA